MPGIKGKFKLGAILLAAALCLAGCVNKAPVLHPETTPGPTRRPDTVTPVPMDEGDFTPAPTEGGEYDAKGELIGGPEHFIRYLTFLNILVYEEEADTYLDGVVRNDYPTPIICAIDVVYHDDSGREIARSRLQMRDGNYLLTLRPGETVVLARILTDMTLTDRDFTFEFDMEIGVLPLRPETE